jgi:proteasome lid subunit RPN8/RPN11
VLRLATELNRARQREIGGVLVGEQLAPDVFRLVDFSVQRSGGTATCFVCEPDAHREFLEDFFQRTGANYSRFNYLGEWHSHPLFSAAPSRTDVAQMQSLVDEAPDRRPFALLLVVRLARRKRVEVCPLIFRAQYEPHSVDVSVSPRPEGEEAAERRSWMERLLAPTPKLELVVTGLVPKVSSLHGGPNQIASQTDETPPEERK